MRSRICFLIVLLALAPHRAAQAKQAQSPSAPPPAKVPAKKPPAPAPSNQKSKTEEPVTEPQAPTPDPDSELQLAVRGAGNDPATLIQNLEAYLLKYPDTPRRGVIYRALLEAEMQVHNSKTALEYAEKIIAIQPEDSQSMYLAVTILEKMPDDASQLRGVDYDTRLLERVAKADPESRPQQMTLEDWQAGRNRFISDLYVLRGRMQHRLRKNDQAVKDLTAGFRLVPNADAALSLGEIAEEEKRADEAIRQYATAFMLAGQDQPDAEASPLNRESLRLRIGNLWKFTHTSNTGLGDILLSAYDHSRDLSKVDKPDAPIYNKDLTDPLQFSLRRIDGSGPVKLSESRGKVVVLSFWTTWCTYCNQLESLLAEIRKKFAGRDDVAFLTVNADQEESLVRPFLQEQNLGGTLVFADGVDLALHVESIPTVLVLDKAGKIAYRIQGFAPDGFADVAAAAVAKASAAPAP